jgi:ribosomal protein L14
MYKESQIRITDNTGAKRLKLIGTYKFHNVFNRVSSLFISSLIKVAPRIKFKKGSLFRAYTVRVRFATRRYNGFIFFSSANRSILFKAADLIPVANRIKGYIALEVFVQHQINFPAITIYTF